MTKKKQILEGLKNCKPEQVDIFILMYGEIGESIESVVSKLHSSKVSWALKQVENTIKKNSLPPPPPKPVPVVDEKVEFKKRIENFAFDLSDKDFFFSKRESVRKIVGGSGSVVFDFEGKSYRIDWNGYWGSSDWYEYQISDVPDRGGLKISGTRYID